MWLVSTIIRFTWCPTGNRTNPFSRAGAAAKVDAQVNLQTKPVQELLDLDLFEDQDVHFFCTFIVMGLSPSYPVMVVLFLQHAISRQRLVQLRISAQTLTAMGWMRS